MAPAAPGGPGGPVLGHIGVLQGRDDILGEQGASLLTSQVDAVKPGGSVRGAEDISAAGLVEGVQGSDLDPVAKGGVLGCRPENRVTVFIDLSQAVSPGGVLKE